MTKKEECLKALNCLYLEVPASIADDVKQKVLAALEERHPQHRELVEVAQEFCDRVEAGEVRSTYTYGRFKKILNL